MRLSLLPLLVVGLLLLLPAATLALRELSVDGFATSLADNHRPWLVIARDPVNCNDCSTLVQQVIPDVENAFPNQLNFVTLDCSAKSDLCTTLLGDASAVSASVLLFQDGAKGAVKMYQGSTSSSEELKQFLVHAEAAFTSMPSSLTLRYFETRGRAEVLRYALEEGAVKYEQDLVKSVDWPEVKRAGLESGEFMFGQMPAMTCVGCFGKGKTTYMVQTQAMLRFIGRRYGLYPSTEEQRVLVDMIVAGVDDARSRYARLVYDQNFDFNLVNYVDDAGKHWLSYFAGLIEKAEAEGREFLVGHKLTIADLAVFDLIQIHLQLDTRALHHESLLRFHTNIRKRPRIRSYFTSQRRPHFQNGMRAFADSMMYPTHWQEPSEAAIDGLEAHPGVWRSPDAPPVPVLEPGQRASRNAPEPEAEAPAHDDL